MSKTTLEIASESVNGRMVAVAATTSPGTLIHAAVSGVEDSDSCWIYAVNVDPTDRELVIEFGGTATSDRIPVTVPARSGLVLVVPGLPLQNSLEVRAYAAVTNVINVACFSHKIDA